MIDIALTHANILIVDDQQANIDVLTGLLDVKGFTSYVTTTDPREVITLFNTFKPDILLLDLNMPYLNGFQVMEQINIRIPTNAYIPILILTAEIAPESKQLALATGASDFLTKPFDLIEIDLRIKNLLKVRYLHQQLEMKNQILEEKVIERTAELEESNKLLTVAKNKAEGMDRLKTTFLTNMSHELRTPLTGINGFADFLRQKLVAPELKEMAELIFESGNRLSETLGLILDLSELESEKLYFNVQRLDLVSEIRKIIYLITKTIDTKGLYIKVITDSPSVYISTDERAIATILNNLIKNAIKFTDAGGIHIVISRNEDHVQVQVVDTGIGIAKSKHKIIFEEFRQASEGINRNFEGTGLGLFLTKKIVEKIGGCISVESEIGKGSTFTITLPTSNLEDAIKDTPLPPNQQKPNPASGKTKRPVALLVDDDANVFLILKRYTADFIDLENIMDGKSAIKLCMQKRFDLIFMDINLQHSIDGKQVTNTIRKINGYESIPIIATTAYAMVGDKEEFLAAGCSHYMSKPFRREVIEALMYEILSSMPEA